MTQEQHVQFWKDLAGCVRGTRSIAAALDLLIAKASGAYPATVPSGLRHELRKDITLSRAMANAPDQWPATMVAMIRAAEANGTLDLTAARISEAVADGALLHLPASADQASALAWFWRGFSHMVAASVPMGQTLEALAAAVDHAKLRDACQTMRDAAMGQQRLAGAMRQYPDLFPARVQEIIAAGEQDCTLDVAALEVARMTSPASSKPASVDLSVMSEAIADKIVTAILLQSIKDGASDIHFQPEPGGSLLIRYRIDGVLYEMQPPPADVAPAILARLKVMANLDVETRSKPQDGRILVTAGEQRVVLRINVLPAYAGERIVVRLLRETPDPTFAFDRIGLSGKNLEQMEQLCGLPRGLIVVASPSGNGTTTTTYSMVNYLNKPDRAIITVEDPVECTFAGISHVQVSPSTGLTFSAALWSALRQAPNIIMASDIRDRETALLLTQAALTGHLVIVGTASDGALTAIRRMLDLEVEPYMVSTTLRGIISQRIVRRVCTQCRTRDDLTNLKEALPVIREYVQSHPDTAFSWGRGCDQCGHTGYRGRIGVFDIVLVDDALRHAILANDTPAIRNALAGRGGHGLVADALAKAAEGITSLEEVTRLQAECLV